MGPGVVTRPGASPVRSVCAALVPTPRECVLLALFLVHYAMVYLDETFCHTVPHFRTFVLAAEYLQALPIRLPPLFQQTHTHKHAYTSSLTRVCCTTVVLVVAILCQGATGPQKGARTCLALASVLHVLLLEPRDTWARLVPAACVPGVRVVSYYDLTLALCCAPLLLYFAFVVREHERQKEECMFQFIKQSDVCVPPSRPPLALLSALFYIHTQHNDGTMAHTQSGVAYRPF